ncbi:MAG: DUF4125 family protein [Oscillospiraceae bacterium]|jgi:hypothetical protein|nr:DUF4125 family protein [Oscillospiraceae bacterium]
MLPDREVIDQIVFLEWSMFQSVNEESGVRAECQDDYDTFDGMRRGQFEAWSQDAAESYLKDLMVAAQTERNLISEKYIRMMKPTAPARYETLAAALVKPSPRAQTAANEISEKLLTQTSALFAKYPYVSGSGRPLRSSADFSGVVSIETYQLGELLTYSERTLLALRGHLLALEEEGRSLAEEILLNSVKFYGYKTLAEAEASAKAHAEEEVVEISYGCEACGE